MKIEKGLGLYQEETTIVKIGNFAISSLDDKSVWIEDQGPDGGEGGGFSNELLEKCVEEFFNKNF